MNKRTKRFAVSLAIGIAGCYGDVFVLIQGRIVDSHGAAVSGAEVVITPDEAKYPGYRSISSRTNQNGEFRISESLPAYGKGSATLSVRAKGFVEYSADYTTEIHEDQVIILHQNK